MKIALATPTFPKSIADGLTKTENMVKEAAKKGAILICFPETFIPGYPLADVTVPKASEEELKGALEYLCRIAAANNIAIIMPMDWYDNGKLLNVAQVISAEGKVLGYQTKNQLDPSEDTTWQPGTDRHIFEVSGLKFGITICHEGFRYPESVRWAAREGASIVFHPHLSGSDVQGTKLTDWGNINSPYYEKAMMMRALENTIYFASVGYTMQYQEAATSLISPDGKCLSYQAYGLEGVIVAEIDPTIATGLLAERYKPELYE